MFDYRDLRLNTAGMAAVTFATGAYAVHGATSTAGARHVDEGRKHSIGLLPAIAGLVGIAARHVPGRLLFKLHSPGLPAAGQIAWWPRCPWASRGVLDPDASSLTVLFRHGADPWCSGRRTRSPPMWCRPNRRASGYALYIFLIHVFGDISSPLILGKVSTIFGKPAMATSALAGSSPDLRRAIGLENLTVAMLVVGPVLAVGAVFFLAGSHFIQADQGKIYQADQGRSTIPTRRSLASRPRATSISRLSNPHIAKGISCSPRRAPLRNTFPVCPRIGVRTSRPSGK